MPHQPRQEWTSEHDFYVWEREWACTHCCGAGYCSDGADPLGDCPDEPHRCHACGGSGDRKDQVIF